MKNKICVCQCLFISVNNCFELFITSQLKLSFLFYHFFKVNSSNRAKRFLATSAYSCMRALSARVFCTTGKSTMRLPFPRVGPFFPLIGCPNVKQPLTGVGPCSRLSLEDRACREPLYMTTEPLLLLRPAVPPLMGLARSNWLRISTFAGLLKTTLL